MAALEASHAGLEVEIIDTAWRSSAQSYACGLHPASVSHLARRGLEATALDAGVRIDTVGFFEGRDRRIELQLSQLNTPHPFLLVLPQDRLEELLETELRARGVRVRWGHRLDRFEQDDHGVNAQVERLAFTSVGYPVARSEVMVASTHAITARYLVGADGFNSHVRQILGLDIETLAPDVAYDVFEFQPATEAPREFRLAFGKSTTDAFWPQPGWLCRWSLQITDGKEPHPDKEQQAFVVVDEEHDATARAQATRRIRSRAPWFEPEIREVDWTSRVGFRSMMASRAGLGRAWLIGDAAHQTSPMGMQSMNVGLREAADLVHRLARILQHSESPSLLEEYHTNRRSEWRQLLGAERGLQAGPHTPDWARAHVHRLLPCLPGSGPDLRAYAAQLGFTLPD
jgi:2-polyprenyl-6-methoxyphenol hydroxylase-like FAD-dependent oxidoreductase